MGALTKKRCAVAAAVLEGRMSLRTAAHILKLKHHTQVAPLCVAYVQKLIAEGKITSNQINSYVNG